MIDHRSFAPMGVFVETFKRFGMETAMVEARAPMDTPKPDHIHAMLMAARLAEDWQQVHGAALRDADVDRIDDVFAPMNEEVVAEFASLVPGAPDTLAWLAVRNDKVPSITGHTRAIIERVFPVAANQDIDL